MATTDVKKPVQNQPNDRSSEERMVERAQDFWSKNSKIIVYVLAGLVLLVAGYFGYRNYVLAPKEEKAAESIWQAQKYFEQDSFNLALNGDGATQGFLRVISNYGGTDNGNLAKFYAGASYLKLKDFNNAIKYLKDFSTDQPLLKLRKEGLLGDAYSEMGNKKEAVEHYTAAGTMFEEDDVNSPEYLFRAALLNQELGNNQKAIEQLEMIKDNYPQSQRAFQAGKYLGKFGDTTIE